MEIKDGQLKIYKINKNYLKYLSKIDDNVRKKCKRKYYGIIITNNNIDYCIPFTSKIRNRSSKLTIDIKEKDKIIAQLTLNNMIPVKNEVISLVDIDKEIDRDYLNIEIRYLRKEEIKNNILNKASNIFEVLNNKKHPDYIFFGKLCGNFKVLENECKHWNVI